MASDVDKKAVMDKIRKCLALSESSNEHEAAAAMRQAKKLMEKHNLQADSMDLFMLKNEVVKTIYKNPPSWFLMLATVVARAFGCTAFTGYQRITFVGKDACAEVAGYSFDVLLRQLMRQKTEFLNSSKVLYATPAIKRKLGQAFSEGWIIAINKIVSEFAESTIDHRAHNEYLEKVSQRKLLEEKKVKSAIGDDEASRWAASNGFQEGKDVKLYSGVGDGEQQLLISQSTEI